MGHLPLQPQPALSSVSPSPAALAAMAPKRAAAANGGSAAKVPKLMPAQVKALTSSTKAGSSWAGGE